MSQIKYSITVTNKILNNCLNLSLTCFYYLWFLSMKVQFVTQGLNRLLSGFKLSSNKQSINNKLFWLNSEFWYFLFSCWYTFFSEFPCIHLLFVCFQWTLYMATAGEESVGTWPASQTGHQRSYSIPYQVWTI